MLARRLPFVLAVLLGTGCAAILGIDDGAPRVDAGVDAAFAPTDAGSALDGEADAPLKLCNASAPFTSIKPILELDTPGIEEHPRLSADERTVVFQRAAGTYVVFTATRADRFQAFSAATQLTELGDGADPTLDPAGLRIAFASARDGGVGDYDLWTATRPTLGSSFAAPTVIAGVSSPVIDHYASFANSSTLYFSSARSGGVGSEDIYRSVVNGSVFSLPVVVAGMSTAGYEAAPAVTPDELLAYVGSSIAFGDGGSAEAIFVSARTTTADAWPKPILVTELASGSSIPGWISPDRCRLYFSSDRGGTPDLFVAERTP